MTDTVATFIQAIGGLGIFLLGMIVMTDGLRALAGNAIRAGLMRFTRSPASGAMTGAISTAILQSSSATTVAAVGFVAAGLMNFSSALGIVIGANIGTTLTGWLVALLGFKLKLATLALPLIFTGAILRLFVRGRLAQAGYALAGFGLIFVGISTMQAGMSNLQGVVTPDTFPAGDFIGILKLVALGFIITIVTQSSSAGVAAALTALYTGVIEFEQAAALVIGMDVGTTVTALMASIGGSVGARRTAMSHVIYNLFTAVLALLYLGPYTWLWQSLAPGQLQTNAEIALVAFHSSFNVLGVLAILPFVPQFARLIARLVPERGPVYTRSLESALLKQPALALNAVFATVRLEFLTLLQHLDAILGNGGKRTELRDLQIALDDTHVYVDQIHLQSAGDANWERLVAAIHILDHLQRLHERCEEEEDRAMTARQTGQLAEAHARLTRTIDGIIKDIQANRWQQAARLARQTAATLQHQAERLRETLMSGVARGELDVPETTEQLEAIRWLRRVSKHLARITHHFSQAVLAAGK